MQLFDYLLGYYLPAFMYIDIENPIDFQEFENHSDEIKGTFMHEYCHYLQDVSTTYGVINFTFILQELMYKTYKDITDVETRLLKANRGTYGLCNGDQCVEDIIFYINDVTIRTDDDFDYVIVRYHGNKEFHFGNFCIAESMAYLMERRLYNTKEKYNEFPYNMCEIICEKEYPVFAKNKVWIMALCELALLEISGGAFFINALRLMKENNFLPSNVLEIEKFIDKHYNMGFRGERNRLKELLDSVYPECPIDFNSIKKWIISRFELGCLFREKSKCFISLTLSTENIKERYGFWQQIMDKFGAPIVVNGDGEMVQGAYLKGTQINIGDMLAPIAIDQLMDDEGKYKKRSCPLVKICRLHTNISCYSEICEIDPKKKIKEEKLCPVGVFWKLYNIDNNENT